MLTTNLSTRPFYNLRLVRTVLMAVAVGVAGVSVWNGTRYVSLTATERAVGANAQNAESEAARLRGAAAGIVARLDQKEIDAVAAEARRANTIIDQRAFSWTRLFERFEQALPADVRITAIQPRVTSEGRFMLNIAVEARRIEGVDAFIEALGAQPEFRDVLSSEEQTGDGGLIEAVIETGYLPEGPPAATAASPTGGARD